MIGWLKQRLVPEVRHAWRWWSMRLNALGLPILAWVQFGVLALAVMGACAAVVLLGLFMAQIARWVFS